MSRPPASVLHATLARGILEHLRAEAVTPGEVVTEAALAAAMGTSRAPVRGALGILAQHGFMRREARRLVVAAIPDDITRALPPDEDTRRTEILYWRFARDRLDGALPGLVSVPDLMRRYDAARSIVQRLLVQVMAEGWIERAPAGGWRFLPLIEGAAGNDEAYRFRRAIEPAALLDPGFSLPTPIAARLRREQEALAKADIARLDPRRVFETNSGFHLTLMRASNNRFFADAGLRVTRLRRLVEYVLAADRDRLPTQSAEHLAILDRIEANDRVAAAALMSRHLDAGWKSKSRFLQATPPGPWGPPDGG